VKFLQKQPAGFIKAKKVVKLTPIYVVGKSCIEWLPKKKENYLPKEVAKLFL
jgi:hypothetical protein